MRSARTGGFKGAAEGFEFGSEGGGGGEGAGFDALVDKEEAFPNNF